MRLTSNEVEWSLFLPFLKLDPKSRRVVAGISARTDEADDAFIETETGLLPLTELKRELAALSGNRETVRSGLAISVASGALHSSPGEPAKAWWVSARIDDPDLWKDIRAGTLTGLHLRGRAQREIRKRDVSDELRLPAGQPGGGQWTSGGSTGTPTPAPTGSAPRTPTAITTMAAGSIAIGAGEAAPFFGELGAATIAGLGSLLVAASVPVAFFGTLLLPTNTSTTSDGSVPVPGLPNITYHYDQEAGLLELRQNGQLIATGHVDGQGLFRDEQGAIIAREIVHNGVSAGVIADEDGLKNYVESRANKQSATGTKVVPLATTDTDRPKSNLCPDRTYEDITGRKKRGLDYQVQITGVPSGLSFKIAKPGEPGKFVDFDGCLEEERVLQEAKGPGYADHLLPNGNWKDWYHGDEDIEKQIENQPLAATAAGFIRVDWYFAEKSVADYFAAYVEGRGYTNIKVIYRKPISP